MGFRTEEMRSAEVNPGRLGQALLSALLLLAAFALEAAAVPVQVVQTPSGGWQLLRNGQPYYVFGAGGDGSKELLAASGANTFRTWGVGATLPEQLDLAQSLGLTVIVGHWLGHERHGFDYHDPAQLAEQKERVHRDVLAYKDHPALLLWGIGNEMEGIGEAGDPALWNHIQDLAAMIHELDPLHPTMVVTADIGGKRVEAVHKLCPDIDIMGVNSYGGLPSLPARYRALGGSKPYLVTEFGPPGAWESALSGFGVPLEPSSTQKGQIYKDFFAQGCLADSLCLGGCAFIWGSKPEATATWFGMFLPSGEKLAPVDSMTEIWSGKAPAHLCPGISSLSLEGPDTVQAGARLKAVLAAEDPEGAKLKVKWKLCLEAPEYLTFGETWWQPLELGGAIIRSSSSSAELLLSGGGLYRLYVEVSDGAGGAATANVPIKVEGETRTPRLKLPLSVYSDLAPQPWAPSGWMGDHQSLSMDPAARETPRSGETCLKFHCAPSDTWVGVAWQDPPNNWGDLPGGYDLSGAKRLSFWARSDYGGEMISFGVGLDSPDAKYPDSVSAQLANVKLTTKWKRHQIILKNLDLSQVRTPFYWTLAGKGLPVTFYLDDICFE